eukprot:5984335-Amphidinium_carterae.1
MFMLTMVMIIFENDNDTGLVHEWKVLRASQFGLAKRLATPNGPPSEGCSAFFAVQSWTLNGKTA